MEPSRPDAVRVAHRERPAVARHAAQSERAVELGQDGAKCAEDRRLFTRSLILTQRAQRTQSFFLLPLCELLGEELAKQVSVRRARGVVPRLPELLEQLVRVREVEVAGEEERAVEAGLGVDERVTERFVPAAVGGVAQVAEEERFAGRGGTPPDRAEQVREGGGGGRLADPPGRLSGLGREGKDGRAGAVLPAVVLLLEQEREQRPAGIRRPRKGPAAGRLPVPVEEPQQRHGAFVLDFVGHSEGSQVRKFAGPGFAAGSAGGSGRAPRAPEGGTAVRIREEQAPCQLRMSAPETRETCMLRPAPARPSSPPPCPSGPQASPDLTFFVAASSSESGGLSPPRLSKPETRMSFPVSGSAI